MYLLHSRFPFDVFILFFVEESSSATLSDKLLKVFRLTRLMRLWRIPKLHRFVCHIEDLLGLNIQVLNILKLLINVLIIGHIIACAWWFLPDVMTSHPWFDYYGFQGGTISDKYIVSLYWTFTTLSTVGYGDITAKSSPERLLNCFIMLVGASLFGFVVTAVSALVTNLDASEARIKAYVNEVRRLLDS